MQKIWALHNSGYFQNLGEKNLGSEFVPNFVTPKFFVFNVITSSTRESNFTLAGADFSVILIYHSATLPRETPRKGAMWK